jgi:hypothetical protein
MVVNQASVFDRRMPRGLGNYGDLAPELQKDFILLEISLNDGNSIKFTSLQRSTSTI